MKVIRLALHLIWKRKYTYALLAFQMIISIIIFVSLVGKVQHIAHSQTVANIFNSENAFYFTPYTYYDTNSFHLKELLPDESSYEIGRVSNLTLKNNSGENVFAYGYNDTIIRYTNVNLKDGTWFNSDTDYEHIPIISIGSKYSVDDVVTLRDYENEKEMTFKVIATIRETEYITTFMSGGSKNNASLENIVSIANADFIVPFECSKVNSIGENDVSSYNYNYGSIIIMKNSENAAVYELLDQYGEVSDINSMITNFKDETRDYFLSNGIVLLVFTLLGLSGIGGINSMLNVANRKRYTIYFMYGMTQRKCAIIEAIRSGLVIIVSFVASVVLIFYTDIGNLFPPTEYAINVMTFIYVLLYMAGIYLVTSLYFVINLSKQNLMDVYKQKA